MILYHGSNVEVIDIDLSKCKPYKDFGQGFYLTPIKSQAIAMARRISAIYEGSPIISSFEIPNNILTLDNLHIKNFGTQATKEWALFIRNNRDRFLKIFRTNCAIKTPNMT